MPLPSLQEKAIDRDEITALYEWAQGACFRCAATHVQTTLLDLINTPIGDRYEIRACRDCVFQLEDERRRHSERLGRPYRPGQLRGA